MSSKREPREILAEADRLIAEDRWTKADYLRLCQELYDVGSYPGTSMLIRAKPGWDEVDRAAVDEAFGLNEPIAS